MPMENPLDDLAKQAEAIGRDWLWLTSILPCEMVKNGDELRGFSFSPRGLRWLMTVRVVVEGVQQVVFTCTGTPTACVVSFRKRWDEETLQYFPDKYA